MILRNRLFTGWRSWGIGALSLVAASAASAGTLTSVEARNQAGNVVISQATPGTTVQIRAHKTGNDNCGWRIGVYVDDGDMNPANDVLEWASTTNGFGAADPTVSWDFYNFPNQNDYRIQIAGVPHNSNPPCSGATIWIPFKVETQMGGNPGGGFGPALDHDLGVIEQITPNDEISIQAATDLAKNLTFVPNVTGTFGLTKPGGVVAWLGGGFGNQKGKVRVHYTKWNGASDTVNLEILEWTSGMVGTKLPANMTGFQYQTAQVELETHAGKTSTLGFTLYPIEEYKELPASDVSISKCGTDANFNACGQNWNGPGTIRGWHKNSCTIWFAGCYEDDDDWDKYQTVSLKNGWTIAWVNTTKSLSSSNEWIAGPGSPGSGATSWKAEYHWHVSPSDTVEYRTFVDISGPRGVPHK